MPLEKETQDGTCHVSFLRLQSHSINTGVRHRSAAAKKRRRQRATLLRKARQSGLALPQPTGGIFQDAQEESTDSGEERHASGDATSTTDVARGSSSGPQLRAEEEPPLTTQTQVDIFRYYAQHTEKTPEEVAAILEKYAGSLQGLLAELARKYGGLKDHEMIPEQLAQKRALEVEASQSMPSSSSTATWRQWSWHHSGWHADAWDAWKGWRWTLKESGHQISLGLSKRVVSPTSTSDADVDAWSWSVHAKKRIRVGEAQNPGLDPDAQS